MKITVFLSLLVVFVFGASELELSDEQKSYLEQKKVITMCVDPDWEPFEVLDKDGLHMGIAADLIELVSSRLGIKIEVIKTKTWDETLEFSKAKKCDLLSFLNETPKRKEWLTFTEPIFRDPNVIVGRAELNHIKDVSKINASIALPRGTAMSERFANDFKNLTIIPTDSEPESFKLVEDKKADLTLRSLIITAYTIKKEGLFNLKIVANPKGYENVLRIGVLKDEPLLRDILNLGVATISKEDTENIINKYVTIEVEEVTNFTIASWIFLVLVAITFFVFLLNLFLQKKIKIGVAKNIAQEKLLIEQNRRAEFGGLIANIAHQWKNGLSKISSTNIEMMILSDVKNSLSKEEIKVYASDIEKSLKFMSQTMDVFLNFYKDNQRKENFTMSEILSDTLTLIDVKIKESRVAIEINIADDIEIMGIKNEWMHVWLNLINNSIHVALTCKIQKPLIKIKVDDNCIYYQDNSGGFSEGVLMAIASDSQCGLGIKMSKDILKKYGYIMKISNKNDGAFMEICKNNP